MPEPRTLFDGITFGESPRWHDDRLWVSDWGAQEVIAVDLEGNSEVVVRVGFPAFPMCFDWLPDGSGLLFDSDHEGRQELYSILLSDRILRPTGLIHYETTRVGRLRGDLSYAYRHGKVSARAFLAARLDRSRTA